MELIHEVFETFIDTLGSRGGGFILDGGTNSGVMEASGRALADYRKSQRPSASEIALIGICSESKTSYPPRVSVLPAGATRAIIPQHRDSGGRNFLDKNHSHFVFCDQWGTGTGCEESEVMFSIADDIRKQKVPIICILANGTSQTLTEVYFAIDRNYPIVVIEGTNNLADEIADLKRGNRKLFGSNLHTGTNISSLPNGQRLITNPVMEQRVIQSKSIHLFSLGSPVDDLQRLLQSVISTIERDQSQEISSATTTPATAT